MFTTFFKVTTSALPTRSSYVYGTILTKTTCYFPDAF